MKVLLYRRTYIGSYYLYYEEGTVLTRLNEFLIRAEIDNINLFKVAKIHILNSSIGY